VELWHWRVVESTSDSRRQNTFPYSVPFKQQTTSSLPTPLTTETKVSTIQTFAILVFDHSIPNLFLAFVTLSAGLVPN